jgi:hypothetical protein
MTANLVLALAAMVVGLAPASRALAHHAGVYTPRDNDITTNFKQIKFALRASRPDVALRLFETGGVRTEMRRLAARLPEGLEDVTRDALRNADAARAELGLTVLFAALARDLAVAADQQLADAHVAAEARLATGRRFVEAIWRYYNLIDFTVTQRDNKAGVGIRLAIDEAEAYLKTPGNAASPPPSPDRARMALSRIAQLLSAVVDESSPSPRRSS